MTLLEYSRVRCDAVVTRDGAIAPPNIRTSGTLEIAPDDLTSVESAFKRMPIPGVPPGYVRTKSEFVLNYTGTRMKFLFVDTCHEPPSSCGEADTPTVVGE